MVMNGMIGWMDAWRQKNTNANPKTNITIGLMILVNTATHRLVNIIGTVKTILVKALATKKMANGGTAWNANMIANLAKNGGRRWVASQSAMMVKSGMMKPKNV
jgi:hypothetical protein